MRLFEMLIVATILPMILGFFFESSVRPDWLILSPLVTAVFITLHLFRERYRWQMIPAYALFAILLFYSLTSFAFQWSAPAPVWRLATAFLGLLFFAMATVLPLLFPIFRLPKPTGAYPVGTTLFTINEEREFAVHAWYPAESVAGKPATYLPNAPFIWDWLRLVPTHAYSDVPLANAQKLYPVLIFCHGGGFMAVQNSVQMQELASQGYIVFSVGHRHDSAVTVFPDGQTNGRSFWQTWQEMKPVLKDNNKAFETAKGLRHDLGGATLSRAEKKAIMQQVFTENKVALEVVNRRVDDVRHLLDYLETPSNKSDKYPFTGRLKLSQIGVFGHSNGGAVAVNLAMQDTRIKAAINMDGYLFGDLFEAGLQRPFMSMNKDGPPGRDDLIFAQAEAAAYMLTVQGANHFNFMDIYLWMPLINKRYLGTIDPRRAVEIINCYTLAFFDKHLTNKAVPLLDAPSYLFPEVLFSSKESRS